RSPQVELAAKIARNVKLWTGQGARADEPGSGRVSGARTIESPRWPLAPLASAASAGDVLVLVRQRGPLFEAIIRALKTHGIAVAGADRLVLTEHIAVMDLMVLADALL